MQFLYFLQDAPAQVRLTEWGLSHVCSESKSITSRQCQSQHMGNGLLVTRGDTEICRIDPDGNDQVFFKMPHKFTGGKNVWCGWWTDQKPNAESLARKQQLPGVDVPLISGHWKVPILRKYIDSDRPWPVYRIELPTILEYDTEGNLTIGAVIPEYRDIWLRALQVADFLVEGNGKIDTIEAIEFAGQVLRINYHVSMFELVTLGLMTQENSEEVVWQSIDMHGWRDRIKNLVSRSQSSGTNSENGGEHYNSEENTAPTDQPLLT
jgi:hypothetical protein